MKTLWIAPRVPFAESEPKTRSTSHKFLADFHTSKTTITKPDRSAMIVRYLLVLVVAMVAPAFASVPRVLNFTAGSDPHVEQIFLGRCYDMVNRVSFCFWFIFLYIKKKTGKGNKKESVFCKRLAAIGPFQKSQSSTTNKKKKKKKKMHGNSPIRAQKAAQNSLKKSTEIHFFTESCAGHTNVVRRPLDVVFLWIFVQKRCRCDTRCGAST